MEALTNIAQPHRINKLQFPTALRERFIAECGFTLEEKTLTFGVADIDALQRHIQEAANGCDK